MSKTAKPSKPIATKPRLPFLPEGNYKGVISKMSVLKDHIEGEILSGEGKANYVIPNHDDNRYMEDLIFAQEYGIDVEFAVMNDGAGKPWARDLVPAVQSLITDSPLNDPFDLFVYERPAEVIDCKEMFSDALECL
jgi:hypothetical protein